MNVRRLLLAGLLCISLLSVAACSQPPDARGGTVPPANPPAANTPQPAQDMPAQVPAPQYPTGSPADEEDGEFTILPFPSDDDGEASIMPLPLPDRSGSDPHVTDFLPVDQQHGHWEVSGTDALAVAMEFVLGGEPCDCADTSAAIFEETDTTTIVEVLLAGARDDSIRDILYRVTLTNTGGVWTVESAQRQFTCHRGVSDGGLCR